VGGGWFPHPHLHITYRTIKISYISQMNLKTILDDLKIHGCISDNSSIFISGEMDIDFTMEEIEYLKDKERVNQVGQLSG